MVEPNVTMLRNLVSNIEAVAPLQNVSLIQGYKVYGAHSNHLKRQCAKAILPCQTLNLTLPN